MTDAPLLWRYHVHYFDDLNAAGWPVREGWHRELMAQWIQHHPPGMAVAWDPYPLSRRMVNWIKRELASSFLWREARHSLFAQAHALWRSMEHHLQGNHLWMNVKALFFAGLFFGGLSGEKKPARWLDYARRLLDRELRAQVKPDGSHYEQSPMYHALILEDLLDLINVQRAYGLSVPAFWCETAGRMMAYLEKACHPDGQICLFNDAAMNMAPPPGAITDYARRLGISPQDASQSGRGWTCFPDSGLVRLENDDLVLFFDTGPIGPDHIPGHAHADNLTLEMSCRGRRFLVDSGTGRYGRSAERLRQRGTQAHNTVVVDGADSSEVWSGFRVARRARPLGAVEIVQSGEAVTARAGHDGYGRLAPGLSVWRLVTMDGPMLYVADSVVGRGHHDILLSWHFDPSVEITATDEGGAIHWSGRPAGRIEIRGADTFAIESGTYHPAFGRSLPNKRLVIRKSGRLPLCLTTIFQLAP